MLRPWLFLRLPLRLVVWVALCCVCAALPVSARESTHPQTEHKPLAPPSGADGISARLIPQKSQTVTFPEATFSLGVYKEALGAETRGFFRPTGLGVILGFEQHIVGVWSGGVEARWSDWKALPGSGQNDTSPLSLFSKVTAKSDYRWGSVHWQPYLAGGLGYTSFFDTRSLSTKRSKTAFGEAAATYGLGIRWDLPTAFFIRAGVEQWRGLQTSSYLANVAFVAIGFGDTGHF